MLQGIAYRRLQISVSTQGLPTPPQIPLAEGTLTISGYEAPENGNYLSHTLPTCSHPLFARARPVDALSQQITLPIQNYQTLITQGSQKIAEHIKDPENDRGILVAPVGLRDMLEDFIYQQLFPPDITNNLKRFQDPDTGQVNIVIVIRGQDNFSRWQNRLNRLVGSTHFMKDRSTWEIKKMMEK